MSDPGQCRQVRPALGVYLLGAISPAERSALDHHLAGCADCREELAGLASLVGRLGTVSAADAVMLSGDTGDGVDRAGTGDGGTRMLLRRAARLRRRRMWRRVALGTAVTALAAGAAVTGIPPLSRVAYPSAAVYWPDTVYGTNPASGAGAIIRYRARPWGVQIILQVSQIPAGTRCELRVLTATGQEATAASWTVAASRNTSWLPASAPFAEAGVRDFVVMSAGQTLVSVRAR
ncbi:MAG TPA: zf-HC2 domain-containing protein [Streptosporangiaceae bacterium]